MDRWKHHDDGDNNYWSVERNLNLEKFDLYIQGSLINHEEKVFFSSWRLFLFFSTKLLKRMMKISKMKIYFGKCKRLQHKRPSINLHLFSFTISMTDFCFFQLSHSISFLLFSLSLFFLDIHTSPCHELLFFISFVIVRVD